MNTCSKSFQCSCKYCQPSSAPFQGDFVPQAGITFDIAVGTCSAESGPPPLDQFVIDDFRGLGDPSLPAFGGSGSDLEVLAIVRDSAGQVVLETPLVVEPGDPVDLAGYRSLVSRFDPAPLAPGRYDLALRLGPDLETPGTPIRVSAE